jgi:hypothetical protein
LELTLAQRKQLDDILGSGPVAYGLDTGIWTSPMVARFIIIPAMCAGCSIVWASQCNARDVELFV